MKRIRSFVYLLANFRLDTLMKYSEEMERTIEGKIDEYIRNAEQETEGYSENELEEYWDFYIDELHDLRENFPSILRYSVVVSVMSTIEQAMIRVFNSHYRDNPESKHYKKYNNNTLIALSEYMKQEMDVMFPEYTSEWRFLLKLNRIRNNIVHCNGRVYDDKNKESLFEIIEEIEYVSTTSSKEIKLDKQFCEYMIQNTIKFLEVLFTSLEEAKKK